MNNRSLNYFLFVLLLGITIPLDLLWGQSEMIFSGPKIAKAVQGTVALPNEEGQFWMAYDISPYTDLYPNVPQPQQTILNWLLFDTGEKFWFEPPVSSLNATRDRLYVYHHEKVQQYVSNVLDRFVDQANKKETFSIRILTVSSPEWRVRLADYLLPYPVKSKEVQGWLLSKENVVPVIAELARRADCVELNATRNSVANTETFGWVYAAPVRQFVRDARVAPNTLEGYAADTGGVDEGYRFEITPLLSTDGMLLEILFRCESTVVEKMHSYNLRVPVPNAPRSQMSIELPQILHCERKEKVSFPKDQVLLLDLGMIPLVPSGATVQAKGLVSSITRRVMGESIYQNVLIFIQSETTPTSIAIPPMQTGQTPTP